MGQCETYLIGGEPSEDLSNVDQLCRDHFCEPLRHGGGLGGDDALPAEEPERRACTLSVPHKIDGVEDHVDCELVGQPADSASEEWDCQVLVVKLRTTIG